eukprot:GHVU01168932.1.p1 GENE.GHVU01168932.1~~GHVU01168932.1.p1  ORF type:complete len:139 (+),score=14.55 GHVU01168932.1:190-606(+)
MAQVEDGTTAGITDEPDESVGAFAGLASAAPATAGLGGGVFLRPLSFTNGSFRARLSAYAAARADAAFDFNAPTRPFNQSAYVRTYVHMYVHTLIDAQHNHRHMYTYTNVHTHSHRHARAHTLAHTDDSRRVCVCRIG